MGRTSIVNDVSAALPNSTTADQVIIEKWVYGGEALARLSGAGENDGRVVLAPYALPGETVRLDIYDGIHADLKEVLTPSPERVAPPCPLFTRCGGCHYQHAPYAFQVARKVEILREQLRRVGKIEYTGDIDTISGPPLNYRNRAQFHIEDGSIGYLAPRSHKLVPVTGECPISSPRLNQALAEMRERLTDSRFPRFVHSLEIFTNETEVQVNALEADRPVARSFYDWCGSTVAVDYATSFGTFRVSPRSFFQVNRFLIEPMVDAALQGAEGKSALDLYSGVGLFALPLARRFQNVIAVESGVTAARDLEVNAEHAEVKLQTERARVEDFLRTFADTPDFVLADPPRAGLGKPVVKELERLAPPRITIVSCDPATFARDLASLTSYRIDKLTLIDLFPQTFHLETIAQLVRA